MPGPAANGSARFVKSWMFSCLASLINTWLKRIPRITCSGFLVIQVTGSWFEARVLSQKKYHEFIGDSVPFRIHAPAFHSRRGEDHHLVLARSPLAHIHQERTGIPGRCESAAIDSTTVQTQVASGVTRFMQLSSPHCIPLWI